MHAELSTLNHDTFSIIAHYLEIPELMQTAYVSKAWCRTCLEELIRRHTFTSHAIDCIKHFSLNALQAEFLLCRTTQKAIELGESNFDVLINETACLFNPQNSNSFSKIEKLAIAQLGIYPRLIREARNNKNFSCLDPMRFHYIQTQAPKDRIQAFKDIIRLSNLRAKAVVDMGIPMDLMQDLCRNYLVFKEEEYDAIEAVEPSRRVQAFADLIVRQLHTLSPHPHACMSEPPSAAQPAAPQPAAPQPPPS